MKKASTITLLEESLKSLEFRLEQQLAMIQHLHTLIEQVEAQIDLLSTTIDLQATDLLRLRKKLKRKFSALEPAQ